uniref:Uncharacterized protein n=1 Tax=Musa acuminata subsp. malaccensis TaxID=214687 RepID=A0A804IK99_MUSAM
MFSELLVSVTSIAEKNCEGKTAKRFCFAIYAP